MPERGPVTLREEDLDFSFDASWKICSHWDREAVYSALKDHVSGSAGVDFGRAVPDRGQGLSLIRAAAGDA